MAKIPSPDEMAQMPHWQLYSLRGALSANDPGQSMIAPYEHRAFAREWTQEHPVLGALSLPAAIPAYQLYKMFMGARTQPSMAQLLQGYAGLGEGLGLTYK